MEVRTMTSVEVSKFSPKHVRFCLTGVLLFSAEKLLNLITNFSIGNLDVILGVTVFAHKRKEAIFGHVKLQGIST